jgi:cohesin loading factor subunit SCC2
MLIRLHLFYLMRRASVSTAIAQRYLHQILKAAVSTDMAEHIPAFSLLGLIVKQGLAHPVEVSFPF